MNKTFLSTATTLALLVCTNLQAADPIENIRKIYAKANAAELTWSELKPPFEDEYGGSFKRATLNGKIVKAVLNFNMGDHGGSTAEIYYDETGRPIFLFHTSSFWGFTGKKEGETIDKVTERRIYFHEDRIVRALEKKYDFKDEAKMANAASAAKNQPLKYSSQAAPRFLSPLTEMRTAKAPRIVVLANQLSRADLRLTEPTISNKPADWSPIKITEKQPSQSKDLSPANAAFNILITLGIIDEGENADQPAYIDTDTLSQSNGAATVVITLDGLGDDDIQAERYRIELTNSLEKWQLMSIGKQQKKWPDRTKTNTSTWQKLN